jgi:uncharacterized protein YcgI (DUF1989 family)
MYNDYSPPKYEKIKQMATKPSAFTSSFMKKCWFLRVLDITGNEMVIFLFGLFFPSN